MEELYVEIPLENASSSSPQRPGLGHLVKAFENNWSEHNTLLLLVGLLHSKNCGVNNNK